MKFGFYANFVFSVLNISTGIAFGSIFNLIIGVFNAFCAYLAYKQLQEKK